MNMALQIQLLFVMVKTIDPYKKAVSVPDIDPPQNHRNLIPIAIFLILLVFLVKSGADSLEQMASLEKVMKE